MFPGKILYLSVGFFLCASAIDPQALPNAWLNRNSSRPWQDPNWQSKQTVPTATEWPSLPGSQRASTIGDIPSTPRPWGPQNREQQNAESQPSRNSQRPSQNSRRPSHENQRQHTTEQEQRLQNRTKISDDDIKSLTEKLFDADANNVGNKIKINYQSQTRSNSLTDAAPQPLLVVSPDALSVPTIEHLQQLYDNYIPDTSFVESVTAGERQEESSFLDKVLETSVMKTAMEFLGNKGFVEKNTKAYKDLLNTLWFTIYSRGGGILGSSAFEHVFLGEVKKDEVSGLHNWVYFASEEKNNHADYMGYLKKLELGTKATLVKIHFRWSNIIKPTGSLFVGTSPELEMALYTVCFYARPNDRCYVQMGGKTFTIQTYKFNYRGKTLMGSAYPTF